MQLELISSQTVSLCSWHCLQDTYLVQVVLSLISLKVKCTCHNCIFRTAENSTTSVDWKQTLFLWGKHTALKSWSWNKQNEVIFHTVFSYLIKITSSEVALYQWELLATTTQRTPQLFVWKKLFQLSWFRWLPWIFFKTVTGYKVLICLQMTDLAMTCKYKI